MVSLEVNFDGGAAGSAYGAVQVLFALQSLEVFFLDLGRSFGQSMMHSWQNHKNHKKGGTDFQNNIHFLTYFPQLQILMQVLPFRIFLSVHTANTSR